jgi:RNA polymerase sigma-70 factor (ECF subfamily)
VLPSPDHYLNDYSSDVKLQSDVEHEPEYLLEQAETRQEVWSALGRLSPPHRAAVVQRYYLDMSETEMAVNLGCPSGTIKSRLHAARTHLRLLLQPYL